jgi:hypothetical protein
MQGEYMSWRTADHPGTGSEPYLAIVVYHPTVAEIFQSSAARKIK